MGFQTIIIINIECVNLVPAKLIGYFVVVIII